MLLKKFGIIPANTGKIPQGSAAAGGAWDHPREYGENTGRRDSLRHLPWIIPANTGKILRASFC